MLYRDGILMRISGIKYEMYQLRLKLMKLEDCHNEIPDDNLEEEILKTVEMMDSVSHKLSRFLYETEDKHFGGYNNS